jgi:aminoglycoside phosphotransferase family enzyme
MLIEHQSDTIAFLRDEAGRFGPVETIATHISTVFLAGDRALKLKRPVRFPYLDFSTPSRRLGCCQAEVDLNRRTAPTLYLGVHRIMAGPH